jgi:hypothetical protein
VPDVNSQVVLSLIQTTGAPNPGASVFVKSADGNNAQVQIECVGGGNADLYLGTNGSVDLNVAGVTPTLLSIQDANAVTYMSVDVSANVITLGNPVVAVGTSPSVTVNVPLTYSASAGAPKAAFPAIVLGTASGSFIQGDNSLSLGGLAAGVYAIYGDTGASTDISDLDCRFNSIVQINPVGVCSGGAGGADTGWNLSPNGTGGLTLNLTNAPTSALTVKAYPIYLF